MLPEARIRRCALADGGDGTAAVLAGAFGGEWVHVDATPPLGGPRIPADWLRVVDPPEGAPEAVVEMARASGLTLVPPDRRDPLVATSEGTGELIAAAAAAGARRLWLTLGGSATVDGGTGMARALGWRFLDDRGRPLPPGGGALERIARLVAPPRPLALEVTALHDVDNPLVGPRGAAAMFGPQKGATPDGVAALERGLAHLADLARDQLGLEVATLPGGGAAGGLGAGAVAFLGATLERGIDRVLDAVGFDAALEGVDIVLTGEGRLDAQSLDGKVVSGVLARARRAGVPVAVLAGRVALNSGEADAAGFARVGGVAPADLPEADARARAPELLEAGAARLAREWLRQPPPSRANATM